MLLEGPASPVDLSETAPPEQQPPVKCPQHAQNSGHCLRQGVREHGALGAFQLVKGRGQLRKP